MIVDIWEWEKVGLWVSLWKFNSKASNCYSWLSGTFSGSLSLALLSVLFVIISRNSLKLSLSFPVWSNFLKAASTWKLYLYWKWKVKHVQTCSLFKFLQTSLNSWNWYQIIQDIGPTRVQVLHIACALFRLHHFAPLMAKCRQRGEWPGLTLTLSLLGTGSLPWVLPTR